jgi:hypothetical protein
MADPIPIKKASGREPFGLSRTLAFGLLCWTLRREDQAAAARDPQDVFFTAMDHIAFLSPQKYDFTRDRRKIFRHLATPML